MPPSRTFLAAVTAMAAFASSTTASAAEDNSAQIYLGDKLDDFTCTHPPYKVHIVSKSPSVIYLTDFLTPFERVHLREITKDTFAHSAVTSNEHSGAQHHAIRTSASTSVAPDAVVRCIQDRALFFQGLSMPRSRLEPLQLVRYAPGERYHYHTDWFTDIGSHATAALGGNRATSFFAYVGVSNGTADGLGGEETEKIKGGGTNFPLLQAVKGEEWCGIVDCDEEWENGVTFRPVEGNAIFWENLLPNGAGDQRVLHAGLSVQRGEKIGMNIWTRQGDWGAAM